MSTRKIKDAVDLTTGQKVYVKGHAKATYMSTGVNVETAIESKQDTLVSGENIKTINGQSLLGSGNITIEAGEEGISILPMINVTYAELKALRDNSELVPGQQYRITDYETKTTQSGTTSAGHPFDVIVTALDDHTLSENASAIRREDDTYFETENLEAWQLKYCLDNDTDRFAWANTENGKGVIYRMIDERGNDCPYDFKNIMFKHPKDTTAYPDYYYTFTTLVSDIVSDHSLNSYCYNNVIKENTILIAAGKYGNSLNKNVFINTASTSNCYNNSFGDNCYNNSFGNGCYYNSFGDKCYYNSFGNGCYNNSFGNICYYNSFGNGCYNNSLGNGCYYNSFGDKCYYNSFGNSCNYNSFGNSCNYNSFGNGCNHISFRDVASNTGTLLDYCQYNTFDDGCNYIIIWNSTQPTSSNILKNIKVDKSASSTNTNYVYYNITTTNSTKPIFVSKEYNSVNASLTSSIPIGLYNNSSINSKVYSTNVTVTPSKSCVNAAGGFYETSDERLKNFSDDVMIDLEKLSSLRKKYFTWKDGHGDKQLGVSAQEVQVLYPELVNEGDDGNLSVDYAKLSVVALSAVDKLYNKQKYLEDKLAKIEKALNL